MIGLLSQIKKWSLIFWKSLHGMPYIEEAF